MKRKFVRPRVVKRREKLATVVQSAGSGGLDVRVG